MAHASSSNVDDVDFLVRQKNRIQNQLMREKDDHLGLSKGDFPDKSRNYVVITTLLLLSGILFCYIHHKLTARGRQRTARHLRTLAVVGFVVMSSIFATYPDFLTTRNGRNGFRNLALIYFANIELLFFIVKVNTIFTFFHIQTFL